MVEGALRPVILAAAQNRWLRRFANRQGMRFGAARFVAGTTLDDFVTRCRAENRDGRRVAAGYLGEGIRNEHSARRITGDFLTILDRISTERLDSTLAVKLTHLGLEIDREIAEQNLITIVEHAARYGNFVRIDMEEARHVDATLDIYLNLRSRGIANVGIVLQSYLKRSAADLAAMLPLRPNIRIVKGAYLEDPSIVYRDAERIRSGFLDLATFAFDNGCFVAAATHDDRMIDAFLNYVNSAKTGKDNFELQMLLGVRNALQERIVAAGHPLRVSVPFGSDWYPYLMRRMAERPANLALILQNLW